MKIKTKLLIGFGSILVLLIILSAILLNMMDNLNANMDDVVKSRYERVRLANLIQHEISMMSNSIRELLSDKTEPYDSAYIVQIEANRENALNAIGELWELVAAPQSIELVAGLKQSLEEYIHFEQEVIGLVKAGDKEGAANLLNEGKQIRLRLYDKVKDLTVYQEQKMAGDLTESSRLYVAAKDLVYLFVLAFLIAGAAITYWLINNITGSINGLTGVISFAASRKGADSLPRVEVIHNDEIGEIAKAYNEMASALEEHARSGRQYTAALEEQSWIKASMAEISGMYQGVQDLEELAYLVISKVTPLVGASYGVLYYRDKQEEIEYLRKLSAYAFDGEELGTAGFAVGEGLVGQCFLENKTIHLNQVPDNYIKIKSGLGMALPASIIIMPVEFKGQVLAVIELASFKAFTSMQLCLLQNVMGSLGITIDSIVRQMQVKRLLAESQIFTEELQSQSEELQLQQEELRSINEKLEEQYKSSEQKKLELEKIKDDLNEKARQLEVSSKYKTEFLANMSHELRTPLNSLLILSQILAENKDGNLTGRQVEYANTINNAGNDLLQLINDILELSKVEAGKLDVKPGEVILASLARSLEQQFSPLANRQGIEFLIQIDSDLPECIYTDEQRLQQITKNLLSNAFKFTEKGFVSLVFRQATKDDNINPDIFSGTDLVLAIAVSDTGIGIPKAKQKDIFEAFQQADGTTSRKYGGTGLGLSISREIARLLGGYIELESAEGKGSTFTLYLPCYGDNHEVKPIPIGAEIAATGSLAEGDIIVVQVGEEDDYEGSLPKTKQQEENLPAGKKVLIIDDDMRNLFVLTTVLEEQQMKVMVAENGREGIEKLRENPDTDLVLMDIMMPEMDGYESTKAIRQIPEFANMPIIALTAKAMKNDREICIEAGASDYISKPVNVDQLLSLIRVWLYR